MAIQTAIQDQEQLCEAVSHDKVETCIKCGSIYLVVYLKTGESGYDFGLRHCPFCGLATEEATGRIVP